MPQKFKTIYFPDHPSDSASKKNVKLAFGKNDVGLYDKVINLTSEELRQLLGNASFKALCETSQKSKLSFNSNCLKILRQKLEPFKSAGQHLTYLNPIQSTFRGGKTESLHRWYPFLEGYSPQFVTEVYNAFGSGAQNVFDPFAGSGTTPITVARLGLTGYYGELNPLMQFLIETKIMALSLTAPEKDELISNLVAERKTLKNSIQKNKADAFLKQSYFSIFGKSKFFDDAVFKNVLSCRTYLDSVYCRNLNVGRFLAVAVLASLVPASRLKRAGDLRYKNSKEILREKVDLLDHIEMKIDEIIEDLNTIERFDNPPQFIYSNSRNLSHIPKLNIESVITSPPYLNGTNYFRNTKVELWFLRALTSQKDLANYRLNSITGGINDVSMSHANENVEPFLRSLIKKLRAQAYDRRIPLMVGAYFSDMKAVFAGLASHMVKGSTMSIDIGDSSYGGIHVPTDTLLCKLLDPLGFQYEKQVLLRKRISRDRTELKQVLLVFKYKSKKKTVKKREKKPTWQRPWTLFKKNLPHQQYPYSKRNWGNSLHSLCSYQGKMKPALAHHLIRIFLTEKSTMLDPFSGTGTIPFEAALNGHQSYGFEISPLGMALSSSKLSICDPKKSNVTIEKISDFLHPQYRPSAHELTEAKKIKFNGKLESYFHPKTFTEILKARKYFELNPPQSADEYLVLSCLLHILHGNRPYALSRNSHPITPFAPTGDFIYKSLIHNLKDKVMRSLDVPRPDTFVEGQMFFTDATRWWPQEVDNLDAVITSPPFFDSTRFHLGNWMRLWFCGWNSIDFSLKPLSFVDERQKKSLKIYEPIIQQSRERLKSGGVLVLHLGRSKKCDMGQELARISKRWFRKADLFSESSALFESHGIRDKGTVTDHQFLILT